jgi:hypothetical protein
MICCSPAIEGFAALSELARDFRLHLEQQSHSVFQKFQSLTQFLDLCHGKTISRALRNYLLSSIVNRTRPQLKKFASAS